MCLMCSKREISQFRLPCVIGGGLWKQNVPFLAEQLLCVCSLIFFCLLFVIKQKVQTSFSGVSVKPPSLKWTRHFPGHRGRGSVPPLRPKLHLLHRLSPAVDTVHQTQAAALLFFQDSAVSRRAWPWTGFRGSWVSCRTLLWGKCQHFAVLV